MSNIIAFRVGLLPVAFPQWIIALGLGRAIALSLPSPAKSYRPFSHSEVTALTSLHYPQSERSVLNRFGRPLWSNGYSDYYPTHTNGMAQVSYVGHRAQGVRIDP